MTNSPVDPFQTGADGKRRLPSFSIAERDRRYARVRKLMRERNLVCLLAPAADNGEPQANSRYLCQMGGVQGGAWVVFPAEGEATVILSSERELRMWAANLFWPSDIRWGDFSKLVPERLRELAFAKARIGVTGLHSQYRMAEGTIPFETWRRITTALPDASFVPANDILEFARIVKGSEEVAVIQRITDANEAAIARMMEVAKPGMEEGELWIEMAKVLIAHTADYPARLSLGSNNKTANASNSMGLPIAMEEGQVLCQEIDARLQGYRAQCNHSIMIGSKNAARLPCRDQRRHRMFSRHRRLGEAGQNHRRPDRRIRPSRQSPRRQRRRRAGPHQRPRRRPPQSRPRPGRPRP